MCIRDSNEAVCLVDNKDKIVPATDYCDAWNEKRSKELIKLAEKDARTIATIPRKLAKNYNIDYVGRRYESLDVLECVNNSLESVPTLSLIHISYGEHGPTTVGLSGHKSIPLYGTPRAYRFAYDVVYTNVMRCV